jgi:hypothetical protein
MQSNKTVNQTSKTPNYETENISHSSDDLKESTLQQQENLLQAKFQKPKNRILIYGLLSLVVILLLTIFSIPFSGGRHDLPCLFNKPIFDYVKVDTVPD